MSLSEVGKAAQVLKGSTPSETRADLAWPSTMIARVHGSTFRHGSYVDPGQTAGEARERAARDPYEGASAG